MSGDSKQMVAQDRRIAHAFKADADALEEAPVPVSAHAALYVVLVLLGLAVVWAMVGTLDRIVVAPGKIATRTPLLVMQPFTTSRVLKINVKAGDHVKKGQVLVNFDPSFAQADVSALHHKVNSLTAQAERLAAELSGAPFAAADGDAPERLAQTQIYQQEMSDYRAEMEQRDSRMNQIESQIAVDRHNLPGMRDQLGMAQNVVGIQKRLQAQAAAAHLDVMRAESAAIDAQQRLQNTQGDLTRLAGQRAEAVQERNAYMQKWRSDHGQQLVEARQNLSEARETLNKALKMQALTEMTAPVDGTVLQVADRSQGSVLREAETLVTLVPDGADLYVEANVPSRDVSYLKVGDAVRVKLEAYPFQRYGTADGVLEVIGADSTPLDPGDGGSPLVYRAQVRITDPLPGLAGRGIRLRPGMVASAEITTGKRSIMSYILDPILRTADEGLREP
jgi:HlyD family secretion protein